MSQSINVKKVLVEELMENSPDYIFIKDRQSRFIFTNKAHAHILLGLDNPEDAVIKTDFDLFPDKKEYTNRFFEEEQTIMETGQPVLHRQWKVPSTATGKIVWLSESKMPIRNESGIIIGLIGIGRDITALKTAEISLEHASTEIKELNNHLKHLAERDGLTGIYNRRFFDEYFEIEVQRAANFQKHEEHLEPINRSDMNFGLAIIDIDNFKTINDTYGHLVGDDALKQIIKLIQKNIFSRDVLCRFGGDEFALLLTKTSSDGILQAIEKIRKEIDEHNFNFGKDHKSQHITISVGLVNFDEVNNKECDSILKLADDRLFKAKSKGRNRIEYLDDRV